jgi:phosphate transport system substrate-binding protein
MRGHWVACLGAVLALAVAAIGQAQTRETIVVDGSTGVMPLVTALAKAYHERHPGVTLELGTGLGTKQRLQALADGKIHIALASHGLTRDELASRGMVAHEIAKVAVVFGVNASVPVTSLSDRQICDVYIGRVATWQELGGPDLAIAPRIRPDSEVDTEVVRDKVACFKDLKPAERVIVAPKSGDMARELAATAGAVGMTTTTVVEQSRGRIRAVALNGVVPSADNVERKVYGLTRDSFLVTKVTPEPGVARFLEFVRSPAGHAVITANGAVPVK